MRGVSSLFLDDKNVIGSVLCSIGYFCFMHPITLSTWIHTFAMFRVSSTSKDDSWLFSFGYAVWPEMCLQTRQYQTHGLPGLHPQVKASEVDHCFQLNVYH